MLTSKAFSRDSSAGCCLLLKSQLAFSLQKLLFSPEITFLLIFELVFFCFAFETSLSSSVKKRKPGILIRRKNE